MRAFLPFLVLNLCSSIVFANTIGDTVQVKEVLIKSSQSYKLNYEHIDSIRLQSAKRLNLQQFLQEQSTLQMKSYGTSGSSVMSMRGANASHSKLTWNGMSLVSPMLNVTDVSLISMMSMDELNIHRTASTASQGTGAMVGFVELKTHSPKENELELYSSYNSLNNSSNYINLNYYSKNIKSSTRLFYINNQNSFEYKNRAVFATPIQKQLNSDVSQWGVIQSLYYSRGKNAFDAHVWYQESDRELSPAMFNLNTAHYQLDASIRNILNYKRTLNDRQQIESSLSYTREQLRYVHRLSNAGTFLEVFNTYSYFDFIQFQTQHKINLGVWEHTAKFQYTFEGANVEDYTKYQQRQRYSFASILDWNQFKFFKIELANRFESTQTEYLWANSLKIASYNFWKAFSTSIQISNNYNIPGLNDLYWSPGGNPNLKSEKSIGLDYTLSHLYHSKRWKQQVQASVYSSKITDWILWQPSNFDNAVWTAQNLSEVQLSGFELEEELRYQINYIQSISLNCTYAYNRAIDKKAESANDQSVGKQLIYVPLEKFNINIRYQLNRTGFVFRANHVSHRFTSNDNVEFLPSYTLMDVQIEQSFKFSRTNIVLAVYCDNMLDVAYESIPFQAMPQRLIGMNVQFKIK